jgi:hypothetical protein
VGSTEAAFSIYLWLQELSNDAEDPDLILQQLIRDMNDPGPEDA